jgi:hypothetical protein
MAVPDTVLVGSDFAELVAWAFLAIPGLLYCAWRHLLRLKVCPDCGGPELMREARAAASRRSPNALPSEGPRIRNESGPVRWPRPFCSPRSRLRGGSLGVLFVGAALSAWLLGSLEVAAPTAAAEVVRGSGLLALAWLILQLFRVVRARDLLAECRTWDTGGRPLHIERI